MIPHFLAFFSGAAVLILEILGARLMAPFYGTSVLVWASLITVTLAALALGYWVGGAFADRRPSFAGLGGFLALAGVWLFLLFWARKPVLLAFAVFGVRLGALLCALALFCVPLACLGTVGPFCVRLKAQRIEGLGRAVGNIYAVSTLGSVLGALVTGFYLIPEFKSSMILAFLSAGVSAMAAACFWISARSAKSLAAWLCFVIAIASLSSTAFHAPILSSQILFHENSFYGDLKVMDRPQHSVRVLYVDGMPNTIVDLDTKESVSDYIHSLELLAFLRPKGRRALLIGLGGGSLSRSFAKYYGIATDAVDIDSKILHIARQYFDFSPSGEVYLEDGRYHLERSSRSYDFIVLDAFNGDRHPEHLFSLEAFQAARKRLTPDGVLGINLIGYGHGDKAGLMRAIFRTLTEVFPYVRVFNASVQFDPRVSYVNLTFFASQKPLPFQRDPAQGRFEIAQYYARVFPQLAGDFNPFLGPMPGGLLITDDYNPVESLSAPAFLAIRNFLLNHFADALE